MAGLQALVDVIRFNREALHNGPGTLNVHTQPSTQAAAAAAAAAAMTAAPATSSSPQMGSKRARLDESGGSANETGRGLKIQAVGSTTPEPLTIINTPRNKIDGSENATMTTAEVPVTIDTTAEAPVTVGTAAAPLSLVTPSNVTAGPQKACASATDDSLVMSDMSPNITVLAKRLEVLERMLRSQDNVTIPVPGHREVGDETDTAVATGTIITSASASSGARTATMGEWMLYDLHIHEYAFLLLRRTSCIDINHQPNTAPFLDTDACFAWMKALQQMCPRGTFDVSDTGNIPSTDMSSQAAPMNTIISAKHIVHGALKLNPLFLSLKWTCRAAVMPSGRVAFFSYFHSRHSPLLSCVPSDLYGVENASLRTVAGARYSPFGVVVAIDMRRHTQEIMPFRKSGIISLVDTFSIGDDLRVSWVIRQHGMPVLPPLIERVRPHQQDMSVQQSHLEASILVWTLIDAALQDVSAKTALIQFWHGTDKALQQMTNIKSTDDMVIGCRLIEAAYARFLDFQLYAATDFRQFRDVVATSDKVSLLHALHDELGQQCKSKGWFDVPV